MIELLRTWLVVLVLLVVGFCWRGLSWLVRMVRRRLCVIISRGVLVWIVFLGQMLMIECGVWCWNDVPAIIETSCSQRDLILWLASDTTRRTMQFVSVRHLCCFSCWTQSRRIQEYSRHIPQLLFSYTMANKDLISIKASSTTLYSTFWHQIASNKRSSNHAPTFHQHPKCLLDVSHPPLPSWP
jgi:hypothetical protein